MLEVNDFNAVRISLASPDQIRSWSYGEVTKPETINYRTLKPEKDGLFCEKIFGPTKDFECYCGKYKRVRFKGVICDKCGVEVTRSKVRRERMGHIDLVSPVSHIWFVKGTPSRLGLLLDISPRSLERILYFAQYIVTWVDEDEKKRLLEEVEAEKESRTADRNAIYQQQLTELKESFEAAKQEFVARQETAEQEVAERYAAQRQELEARYQALKEQLEGLLNQAAPEDLSLGQALIVRADEAVNEDRVAALDAEYNQQRADLERDELADLERAAAIPSAEIERLTNQHTEELKRLDDAKKNEIDAATADLNERIAEINEFKVQQLIPENRYRELHERYPSLFKAGMGAEAVREIVSLLNIEDLREELRGEINSTSGQRRKKATKRLRVVEAFRKSGNRPEWMIFAVLPVLPPDLRPMVQLDGGRFATSDLNDLYRRVINRNNRLRRLLELGAPEIIIRNEKRMLQEAVDSLIDNGRRGRAVSGSSNHKLKSLSDMLKGKQGRFRQNLLGKRVDYSGRSVIVVGSDLKLHQCGLPKRMAIELFKPFIMRKLVERGYAHNIKSAKRIVERVRPEVWDVLDEVIADRPVLLNRAPTLHRLSIQAFQPVLIDSSAIQIHPLVCSAFNADFDGDQMAVHVPLSAAAVEEAKRLMLSTNNLLLPSSGEPTVAPTLDMVLGCYYLTVEKPGSKGEGMNFADFDEAKLAYELGQVDLQAKINVRSREYGSEPNHRLETTVGRILFNDVLPARLRYRNETLGKAGLRKVVADCYRLLGNEETAAVVDDIKNLGFEYATRSGITIAVSDIETPASKRALLSDADAQIQETEKQYRRGLITEEERYKHAVEIWTDVTEKISKDIADAMDPYGSIYMMSNSGAKGNISQIRQMAGMRGLMTDPTGRIIELPIRSSFREGLTVLEYFISTHGARKGLADTALRTADSGYLTRRLIDVAQDIIVLEEDCGIDQGVTLPGKGIGKSVIEDLGERVIGRHVAQPVADANGEIVFEAGELITDDNVGRLRDHGIQQITVRSPLACQARHGICQTCYGTSLATGRLVEMGEAVGIVAAQSIGEPGTQLTMRTFHTGGIAGVTDITTGLPRVEELFEARNPKGQSIISEISGVVELIQGEESRRIKVVNTDIYRDEYTLPPGYQLTVEDGDTVDFNHVLALPPGNEGEDVDTSKLVPEAIVSRLGGEVRLEEGKVVLLYEEKEERDYPIPANAVVRVDTGDRVEAGDQLTEGSINPQDILRVMGREAVQLYLVEEVQKTYRSQGVAINDKHIETIVRNMLRKVRVDTPGDTSLLPGELIDHFVYEETNAKVLAEGGEPATAQTVLLGITKASLNTESFLAAASFQETTRVLTEAAINGSIDRLVGLKENVIIGKLIPAGTGSKARRQELLAAIGIDPTQTRALPELRLADDGDGLGGDGDGAFELNGAEDIDDEDDEAMLSVVDLGESDEEQ